VSHEVSIDTTHSLCLPYRRTQDIVNGVQVTPRAWRESEGLTLAQVGLRLGLTRSAVSKIELGTGNPGARVVRAYFEISGGQVTPNDLFGVAPSSEEAQAA
jgi:DNA-binding XRE family transcriptional regulator